MRKPLTIVATSGTGGDIVPFVALARGLLGRGHRVLMLVPSFHEDRVKAAGVPYQTFGTDEEFQALLNDPDLWDERKGWRVVWNGLLPRLGTLRQLIQELPAEEECVVLCHPFLVPMSALARSVRPDLRIVCAYLAPSNLCGSYDMLTAGSLSIPSWVPISWRQTLWKLIHKVWVDPVTLPTLNPVRAQHGLPAVPHFFEHMLTAPNASLGLFPRWYASAQPDWPQAFSEGDFIGTSMNDSAVLSPELERFLSEGTAPIVFTPGTGHQHAARYFDIAAKVLERLGRRGLFLTPHAAQLPALLPAGVMWQSHAPFSALFPRVRAVVHHGGIGTTAEALRAGVPQLIVPYAYDQFDNGRRAKRLGVADVLLAKRLSVRGMQTRLVRLLASPDVAQACGRLARQVEQHPGLPWLLERVEAALYPAKQSSPAAN